MKATINSRTISLLHAKEKRFDVWDTKIPGFHVRVNKNGRKIYRCLYRDQGIRKIHTIGNSEFMTASEARERAKIILGNVASGKEPLSPKRQPTQSMTFREYVLAEYSPWRMANMKNGRDEIKKLEKFFAIFGDTPLEQISPLSLDRWRTARKNAGISPSTINRDVAALKSALSKAVEWNLITTHPLKQTKPLKFEDKTKIRFLTPDEGKRLRHSLIVHTKENNHYTEKYNQDQHAQQISYSISTKDYLAPMILLSLNTGLRKGELFRLQANQIDLKQRLVTVRQAKNSRIRHIPLNQEAFQTLSGWFQVANIKEDSDALAFTNPSTGKPFTDVKKAWASIKDRANITNFRWHDMRHHFASWLVMAGVPLNTVRELLGHADIKMTLRYAHLAPKYKIEAVSKLDLQLIE